MLLGMAACGTEKTENIPMPENKSEKPAANALYDMLPLDLNFEDLNLAWKVKLPCVDWPFFQKSCF